MAPVLWAAPRRVLRVLGQSQLQTGNSGAIGSSLRNLRALTTSSAELLPLQERITLGLHNRLATLPEAPKEPRVVVVGQHAPLFVAALRAVGSNAGAVAAPVDSSECEKEDLFERIAEVQAHMVIAADATPAIETSSKDAARRLGASWVSATALDGEGSQATADLQSGTTTASAPGRPLFFFSKGSGATTVRAAFVPDDALRSRIAGAVDMWKFTADDTVLSLCLSAGSPTAVVDSIEAPLSVSASVSLPELGLSPAVWDLWAAFRDGSSATIVFIGAEWCEKLLDSHNELAAPLRAELSQRWSARPFRRIVAVASQDMAPSKELAARWLEVFKCPLSWHYSCAEVGSLYVVTPGANDSNDASITTELELIKGELWARGGGLFKHYHDRPKSTSDAFTDMGFCQTGHHAIVDEVSGSFWPQGQETDSDFEDEVDQHLVRGPAWERFGMGYNWFTKKVKIRKYWWWRPKKGYKIITKKDRQNALHLRYTSRYKRAKHDPK